MMRNSFNGTILTIWIAIAVIILSLVLFQSAWLKLISYMLDSAQSSNLPISTSPVSGFSFPTVSAPVPVGVELTVGNMGITVLRVILPADGIVANANKYKVLDNKEQYLMVNIKVHCISTSESCRLTEFDFGVSNSTGRDYLSAELSTGFTGLDGLLGGGVINPGGVQSGALIFIIQKGDSGLIMNYPRIFSFGASGRFLLGR